MSYTTLGYAPCADRLPTMDLSASFAISFDAAASIRNVAGTMNIRNTPPGRSCLVPMACAVVRYPLGLGAGQLGKLQHLAPGVPSLRVKFFSSWRMEPLAVPACQQVSRPENTAPSSNHYGVQDLEWLTEQLSLELVNGGLDGEESFRIATACAEACQRFFDSGSGPFDPMVIMDVMEEEVERRDLRGDFLPFELARKALQILQRRWDGPMRPSQLLEPKENKLDVVNFDRFPKQI